MNPTVSIQITRDRRPGPPGPPREGAADRVTSGRGTVVRPVAREAGPTAPAAYRHGYGHAREPGPAYENRRGVPAVTGGRRRDHGHR